MRNLNQAEFLANLSNNKFIQPRPVQKAEGKIHNTGRVERILKLIIYLRDWHNLGEIAEQLLVSRKSVHRYINLLVHLGFELEHLVCRYNLYRIRNTKEFFKIP
jgi:hypothetical protein